MAAIVLCLFAVMPLANARQFYVYGSDQFSQGDEVILPCFVLNFSFNLFCVHLIHRGCDPSDMEFVNTDIRLQILYLM